jgi:hypothetical protein
VAYYVYGIVEASAAAPAGKGIGGARLSLVRGDDAAALVSEVSGDHVRLGREEVLVHAQVLEQALARGTVLPMRFGVVMSGPEEIRARVLDDHASELREQLADYAGKVEVRIRATYDETSLLQGVVRENPEIAVLREAVRRHPSDVTYYERIRLGELVAGAVESRRERDARMIVGALADAALAVDEGDPGHERVVVQASFLVERERLAQFDRILDEVADTYGGEIRFKYTGPLPPHSFVDFAERV